MSNAFYTNDVIHFLMYHAISYYRVIQDDINFISIRMLCYSLLMATDERLILFYPLGS